jgi:hypothetical protein
LKQAEFEVTIYHILRILQEIIVQYDLHAEAIEEGVMKTVSPAFNSFYLLQTQVVRLVGNTGSSEPQRKIAYEAFRLANTVLEKKGTAAQQV